MHLGGAHTASEDGPVNAAGGAAAQGWPELDGGLGAVAGDGEHVAVAGGEHHRRRGARSDRIEPVGARREELNMAWDLSQSPSEVVRSATIVHIEQRAAQLGEWRSRPDDPMKSRTLGLTLVVLEVWKGRVDQPVGHPLRWRPRSAAAAARA